MSDLNLSALHGRITKDAVLKETKGGIPMSNFCIAVNRTRKVNNEYKDEPHFFWLNLFGDRAKNMNAYLVKGQAVNIVAHLESRKYEVAGKSRSKIIIAIDELRFIGASKKDGKAAAGEEKLTEIDDVEIPEDDFDFDIGFNPEDMQ